MKAFNRTAIALCLSLVILFVTIGFTAADDSNYETMTDIEVAKLNCTGNLGENENVTETSALVPTSDVSVTEQNDTAAEVTATNESTFSAADESNFSATSLINIQPNYTHEDGNTMNTTATSMPTITVNHVTT